MCSEFSISCACACVCVLFCRCVFALSYIVSTLCTLPRLTYACGCETLAFWNDIFANKTTECQDFVSQKYNLKFSNNFSLREQVKAKLHLGEHSCKVSSIFGVTLRFQIFYMQQIDIAAKNSDNLYVYMGVCVCVFYVAIHIHIGVVSYIVVGIFCQHYACASVHFSRRKRHNVKTNLWQFELVIFYESVWI